MDKKKIEALETQIAELKKRWPAHSVPPALMAQLDELEDQLDQAKRECVDGDQSGIPSTDAEL